jgi:hypothetical protein
MDCMHEVESHRGRFGDRNVSAAFHLAVIEQALDFLSENLSKEDPAHCLGSGPELRSAMNEALEALSDLKAAFRRPR